MQRGGRFRLVLHGGAPPWHAWYCEESTVASARRQTKASSGHAPFRHQGAPKNRPRPGGATYGTTPRESSLRRPPLQDKKDRQSCRSFFLYSRSTRSPATPHPGNNARNGPRVRAGADGTVARIPHRLRRDWHGHAGDDGGGGSGLAAHRPRRVPRAGPPMVEGYGSALRGRRGV